MTAVPGENPRNACLDALVAACRRHQYSQAGMLLPRAIHDAEYYKVVDQRLDSVIHELADIALVEGCEGRAAELLDRLVRLKQSFPTGDYDCDFEKLALQQIRRTAPTAMDGLAAIRQCASVGKAFFRSIVSSRLCRWLRVCHSS